MEFAPADRRWRRRSGSVGVPAVWAARAARRAALNQPGTWAKPFILPSSWSLCLACAEVKCSVSPGSRSTLTMPSCTLVSSFSA